MSSDSYVEVLAQMVDLLKDYKPGSITLDNITKLCQTLGLESFIDEVDANLARLSTASKIIVVDIDFDKVLEQVKDVKLVLASNFDHFNYYVTAKDTTNTTGASQPTNILLNSLTQYNDLVQFHENLKFLYLLDTYSHIDIDNGTTTNSLSSTNHNVHNAANEIGGAVGFAPMTTTSSINSLNANINSNSSNNNTNNNNTISKDNGKLDLFKYFTELTQFLSQYFKQNNVNLKVDANLHNQFGIYIISNDEHRNIIAKIAFAKSKDPNNRLFEYIYSETTENWINESPDNYTTGVSLVLEVYGNDIWFPRSFVSSGMIFERRSTSERGTSTNLLDFLNMNSVIKIINGKECQIVNDFTTNLINVTIFDISNDNLDLISDILNWINWYTSVLQPVLNVLNSNESSNHRHDNSMIGSYLNNSTGKYQNRKRLQSISSSGSSSSHRRRRSSVKNRRPSFTESSMLKDEGLQQFNLNEIMNQPVIEENDNSMDLNKNNEEVLVIDEEEDKMDVDSESIKQEDSANKLLNKSVEIVISEDSIKITDSEECSLYDTQDKWNDFLNKFKINI